MLNLYPNNYLDIFIPSVLLLGALIGILRGGVSELLDIIKLLLLAVLPYKYTPFLAEYLATYLPVTSSEILYAISYTIFTITLGLLLQSVAAILASLLSKFIFGPVNALLGVLLGACKSAILLCFIYMISLRFIETKHLQFIQDSSLLYYVEALKQQLVKLLDIKVPPTPSFDTESLLKSVNAITLKSNNFHLDGHHMEANNVDKSHVGSPHADGAHTHGQHTYGQHTHGQGAIDEIRQESVGE